MQYIHNYNQTIRVIKIDLVTKSQAFIEDNKMTDSEATIVAQDLNLSCIHNTVLERYYFRKTPYLRLTINETFIY